MAEEDLSILGRDGIESLSQSGVERCGCAGTNAAQILFDFGERVLNGREVRGVRQQVEHLAAVRFDEWRTCGSVWQ